MRATRARRLPRRRRRARRAARARVEGRRLSRARRRPRADCARCSSRTAASRISRSRGSASACASGRANREIRELAPRRDRVRAAAPRAQHRAGPARLRDRRRRRRHRCEDDLERRDFTVNAMARRLSDGELVDPFGGQEDLEDRVLRTVSPRSFAEDPLRLVRGLRLVSQFDLAPDDETAAADGRGGARASRLVSAERIGGGLARGRDGRAVEAAARLAPGQGAAARARHRRPLAMIPEFAPAIGFDTQSNARQGGAARRAHLPVVAARAAVAPRAPRRAAARPRQAARSTCEDHAEERRADRRRACSSGCATRRACAATSSRSSPRTRSTSTTSTSCSRAASCASTASELARDLVAHKEADLRCEERADEPELDGVTRTARAARAGGVASAPRCADLAVDGSDLLELGYREGPAARRRARRGSSTSSSRIRAETTRAGCSSARRSGWRDVPALGRAGAVRGRVHDARRRRQRRRRTRRSTSGARPATTSSASTRTAAARAPRSAPTPSGSRSTTRCTRRLVHRARAGARGERGDGLWTDEPDLPVLAMSADCLPDRARAHERRRCPRSPSCTPAGAACSPGSSRARSTRSAAATLAAAVGPGIGPCCYEVRDDVAGPFRARFGAEIVQRRASSTSGARPRRRCATPASRASSASTSARRAARSSSSPTAATASRAASRESLARVA